MVLESDPDQIGVNPNERTLDRIESFFDFAKASPLDPFSLAHQLDTNAAAILSGISGLDLNSFILKTELNTVNHSVSEDDVKELKKTLWKVMVPYITWNLKRVFPFPEDEVKKKDKNDASTSEQLSETELWKRADRQAQKRSKYENHDNGKADLYRFTQQNYVLHLTVKIAQSLNMIFELNQKRTFSALAVAAYAESMVDVCTHPCLKNKIKPDELVFMTNYLRRHPIYSMKFNIFTGHKLLRNYSMRASAPAANRKSNDVWMQLNISATNMHKLLDDNPDLLTCFRRAKENPEEIHFTQPWDKRYYHSVAEDLRQRLVSLDEDHFEDQNGFWQFGANASKPTSHPSPLQGSNKSNLAEEEAGVFLPQMTMEEQKQLPPKTRRIVDALSQPKTTETTGVVTTKPFSLLKMFSN